MGDILFLYPATLSSEPPPAVEMVFVCVRAHVYVRVCVCVPIPEEDGYMGPFSVLVPKPTLRHHECPQPSQGHVLSQLDK